jgi:flagellar protein FlaG
MRIEATNAAIGEFPVAAARASAAADGVALLGQAAEAVPAGSLDDALKAANDAMRQMSTNITFEKDDSTGRMVVVVIDSETNQVLRQLPSKDMLVLSQSIDRMRGLLIHLKA